MLHYLSLDEGVLLRQVVIVLLNDCIELFDLRLSSVVLLKCIFLNELRVFGSERLQLNCCLFSLLKFVSLLLDSLFVQD